MIVVIDSDGLIGSIDLNDAHHLLASQIVHELTSKGAKILYPVTVVTETVTFLQGRLNNPELAAKIIDLIQKGELDIEPVNSRDLQEACSLMDLNRSKRNTLFDCIVATVARKYSADAIFSFDKFYKSKGFKLASELLKNNGPD